ncbi:MAG TPA: dihydrodipicolinate synthase family protein [Thermomicrobiales bacterium]|nr:dihydrodipicolinate synthase family protein [Thermomicrobiales bacterium]
MSDRLHGILPIVYTPFDANGTIDEDDVRRLVNYLLEAGAHGLAAVGDASECHKLSQGEREWLVEVVIDEAAGRVPVIVGVSAADTSDSVTLARHAERFGAVAVFATPPLGGKATEPILRSHYGTLARAVEIPIVVQDASIPVSSSNVIHLRDEFPNICYVKEESPGDSGHRITELKIRLGDRIGVLSGGSYLLDDLARGADGAIPGSVGVADLARAYDLFRAGDLAGARAAYDHFLPVAHWRRQFPILGAKEILRRIGVFKAAYLRKQEDVWLDEHDHRELSALMERMGPPF